MKNKLPELTTEEIEIQEELKKLTKARLMAMSHKVRIFIGNMEYSKEDMISHVDKGDDIGQEIMELQLEFLKDLASGSLYDKEAN